MKEEVYEKVKNNILNHPEVKEVLACLQKTMPKIPGENEHFTISKKNIFKADDYEFISKRIFEKKDIYFLDRMKVKLKDDNTYNMKMVLEKKTINNMNLILELLQQPNYPQICLTLFNDDFSISLNFFENAPFEVIMHNSSEAVTKKTESMNTLYNYYKKIEALNDDEYIGKLMNAIFFDKPLSKEEIEILKLTHDVEMDHNNAVVNHYHKIFALEKTSHEYHNVLK